MSGDNSQGDPNGGGPWRRPQTLEALYDAIRAADDGIPQEVFDSIREEQGEENYDEVDLWDVLLMQDLAEYERIRGTADGEPGGVELEVMLEAIPVRNEDEPPPLEGEEESRVLRRVVRITGDGAGGGLNHHQIISLLRGQDLTNMIFNDAGVDHMEVDDMLHQPRPNTQDPDRFPKVPSEEGRKLMESGSFGSFDIHQRRPRGISRRLLDRELGLGEVEQQRNRGLMLQQMLPSTKPEMIIHYQNCVCCGQFSGDGNFFYTCTKDFKVRLYDTSNVYNWRYYKTFSYPFGQWTMTDADLSPDNRWLAFTSLQPEVAIAPTDPKDTGDSYTLNFAGGLDDDGWGGSFGIYSIRFSGDGRQLVAGTSTDSVVVYDIESRTVLHHIHAHLDDVNAVCFADRMSPHILYSGSDDCVIKVWDTRSIGDTRPAAAFVGHTEGLTYIDSKHDGRYILSNGKDQSMKLWDLRKAMSTDTFISTNPTAITRSADWQFDYRWQEYDESRWYQHPQDNSVVTFRGHKVQRTLIRCHFSPPNSTDSRYVYSGSADGHVYIWNIDATLAKKIDVESATEAATGGAGRYRNPRYQLHSYESQWSTIVRDVGWHPNAPILVASSWCGAANDTGTASVHGYNETEGGDGEESEGEGEDEGMAMGRVVDEKLNVPQVPVGRGLRPRIF
ncbi:WD40-repeat-containing domain protein [Apiosordaria backusii]|uniref:WD40-repeat-containing domain protein n=1 Tax=Apiosordaria backusii TaxID=314023 RepID=A0AA40AXS2_9PEZI|nr:WD40-repeat-containing domain protein [Apiosordaria backusii]